jgi:hypothetical protein
MGRTGRRQACSAGFVHHAGSVGWIQRRLAGAPEKQAGVFQLASGGCHGTRALVLWILSPERAANRAFGDLPLNPNLRLPAIVNIECQQG